MWIEVCDAAGVKQGMVNLERMDIVKLGGIHLENYFELTVTQGTTSKSWYIDGADREKLLHWLDIKF